MERLEFLKENWYADEFAPLKSVTHRLLPDFRGEENECWHLRGRGFRWVTLRSNFKGLKKGEEYELYLWAKFDYYPGKGTRCFIIFNEEGDWDNRITYDINPYSSHAIASSGDWNLYKFPFRFELNNNVKTEIVSFEANIALQQANTEDEKFPLIVKTEVKDETVPYRMDQELPLNEYTYLEQRMVKYYSNLLAPFYPTKEMPESCQLEYYEFVKGLYGKLYEKPEEFFTKLYEDDAHPLRFNNKEYGKPKLKSQMKKDCGKMEELFQLLRTLWTTGEVVEGGLLIKSEVSKKQNSMLTYMGFEANGEILKHTIYPNISPVIKYLAEKEKSLWSMMYCWFEDSYPYLLKTHEKFYDSKQYNRLTNWLSDNDYRINIGSCGEITFDYYKTIGKKETPVGYAMYGDKFHYGFTFEYRYDPRVMQHCEVRIIQFAEMLKHFDTLLENTKELILRRTKQCDGCRYCIQVDKTGKRPIAAIKLMDGTLRCPYYPGFNFTYEILTKKDVDGVIALLTDLEKVVKK